MDKTKNILGICILCGFLAVAAAIIVGVNIWTASSRSVYVKGLCEREVLADRAIWPIVFKEGGNSLADLSASVQGKNTTVVEWLKEAGFTDDEISVSYPKIEDTRTYSFSDNNRPFDFIMTSVVTVCSSQVEKVISAQHRQFDLLEKGIAVSGTAWEYPVTFSFNALNEIKPEMIETATRNARAAADKFAQDSGSRVGKIISATQGQFSISERDSNTPQIKIVRVVTTVQYQLK